MENGDVVCTSFGDFNSSFKLPREAELRKNHPGGKEEVKRYLRWKIKRQSRWCIFYARSIDIRLYVSKDES